MKHHTTGPQTKVDTCIWKEKSYLLILSSTLSTNKNLSQSLMIKYFLDVRQEKPGLISCLRARVADLVMRRVITGTWPQGSCSTQTSHAEATPPISTLSASSSSAPSSWSTCSWPSSWTTLTTSPETPPSSALTTWGSSSRPGLTLIQVEREWIELCFLIILWPQTRQKTNLMQILSRPTIYFINFQIFYKV